MFFTLVRPAAESAWVKWFLSLGEAERLWGDTQMFQVRNRVAAVGAALVVTALAMAGLSVTPSYAAADAKVYIVQGLPGRSLDVAVDGKTVASHVKTAAVVGPFSVPGGHRKVTFSDDGTVVLERMFDVKPRSSWDVVVHLPESSSDPTVTVFRNDETSVPKGKAALVVAHTARVPDADIRVDGKVLFADVANGQSLDLVVPVATYQVAIVPAGKTKPVILGPLTLTVKGGALNRVYAIGDPAKKTMNVAVHIIALGASGSERPRRVDTGTGGQAAGYEPPRLVSLLR